MLSAYDTDVWLPVRGVRDVVFSRLTQLRLFRSQESLCMTEMDKKYVDLMGRCRDGSRWNTPVVGRGKYS